MNNELRIEAARKALGIVNRLKPGPYKGRQVRRIFKNLNHLRASNKDSINDHQARTWP